MWLDLARGDQSTRWRRGQGIPAEVYFAQLPELASHDEEALVLICGEVELRRELGDQPALAEYQRRFPKLTDELALQFDVSRLLDAPLDSADSEAAPGHPEFSLPGYEILSEIGRGASGIVYQARQQSLNRLVAIKVMPHGGSDEKRIARQLQEAEILGRLQHPNIVNIYEVAYDSYYVCLIMEFVQGQTLNAYTRGRPLLSAGCCAADLELGRDGPRRSRSGYFAPRSQALQCLDDLDGPAQSHGFRLGETAVECQFANDAGFDSGNSQLHGARTS